MLGKPIDFPERNMHLVILDFQGFGVLKQNDAKSKSTNTRKNVSATSIDAKLFTLCTLLSSSICFNIRKTFDEKTLEDLDMFKELSRLIRIRPSHSAASLMAGGGTPG